MTNNRLIWIDLEMTGLQITKHKIIEIAIVITDDNLKILKIGPCIPIHQNEVFLKNMDTWNKRIHTKTGLIKRVQTSTYSEKKAEKTIILFLKHWIKQKKSPMCGNSIHTDRKFLSKYMKKLENYFHYRCIDVSTIKEIVFRWKKNFKNIKKPNIHTAQKDILYSIKELKNYKKNFFS